MKPGHILSALFEPALRDALSDMRMQLAPEDQSSSVDLPLKLPLLRVVRFGILWRIDEMGQEEIAHMRGLL